MGWFTFRSSALVRGVCWMAGWDPDGWCCMDGDPNWFADFAADGCCAVWSGDWCRGKWLCIGIFVSITWLFGICRESDELSSMFIYCPFRTCGIEILQHSAQITVFFLHNWTFYSLVSPKFVILENPFWQFKQQTIIFAKFSSTCSLSYVSLSVFSTIVSIFFWWNTI